MYNNFFSVDEIIDKHAFNIDIYKHVREHDPGFIKDFEVFAVTVSSKKPTIWWTEMHERVMVGTVYVFSSLEDFKKFKKLNSSFINKINFIL